MPNVEKLGVDFFGVNQGLNAVLMVSEDDLKNCCSFCQLGCSANLYNMQIHMISNSPAHQDQEKYENAVRIEGKVPFTCKEPSRLSYI